MKKSRILVYTLGVLTLVLCLVLVSCAMPASAPQEEKPASETAASAEAPQPAQEESASSGGFAFSTTAIDGSTVDESIFEGKKLVMVNLWEPWCGPCVQEMPDLEKLYQEYKDEGFLLIGAYSTDSGAADIVEKLGISYPILKMCDAFAQYQTQFVPTTVFLDGEGKLLSEQIVGGASYDQWKARIEQFMPEN
ncbi:MAG: TlpA family protein disulfide reductase [Oscillospiraceae bacterium]|nr:TlpA family protein disulfide reductase [Oscillospiraceae bacterium]